MFKFNHSGAIMIVVYGKIVSYSWFYKLNYSGAVHDKCRCKDYILYLYIKVKLKFNKWQESALGACS